DHSMSLDPWSSATPQKLTFHVPEGTTDFSAGAVSPSGHAGAPLEVIGIHGQTVTAVLPPLIAQKPYSGSVQIDAVTNPYLGGYGYRAPLGASTAISCTGNVESPVSGFKLKAGKRRSSMTWKQTRGAIAQIHAKDWGSGHGPNSRKGTTKTVPGKGKH